MLLGRHEGVVGEAEGPVRAAADAVAGTRHQLQRAEGMALEQALLARVAEIEKAMIEAGHRLRQVRDQSGGGLLGWVPSDELMSIITPARAGRRW